MATTGELRAIIHDLQLVDIGDAASYLGEEGMVEEESAMPVDPLVVLSVDSNQFAVCDCTAYSPQQV